jgi:hypothetical protein
MGGWFLKGFQKSIEGLRGQHVDLVDDVDAVQTDLGRNTHLLCEQTDIVDRIVRGSIKLMNAVGAVFVEGAA